ncbi:MAG: hypothetical protein FJ147_13335 [Deltaproteobacteria bacterium]|nr:hypothetical protein [Deltaproteobacteria bacterium]
MLQSNMYRTVKSLIPALLVFVSTQANPVQADNVIADDLIVQGGICVGPECVNGEDFTEIDWKIKFNDNPGLRFQQTTTGGNPAQSWDLGGNENTFFIQDFTRNLFPFTVATSAPTNSFFIGSTGTVGFGTNTPIGNAAAGLGGIHIAGPATADVFSGIGPNPNAGPAFNFGYSGSSFGRGSGFFNVRPDASAVAPNPSLRFATVNTQRMIITNIGRVGIGTLDPQQLLEVAGTVRAQTFQVGAQNLNVPDYVFEPDYKLLPLKQLAKFIEKEKHLPEIPSAKEIKATGLDVTELQLSLLKKVEELTLYTLQQEQQL